MDRGPMLHSLFGDQGRLADSVLPPQHWAYSSDVPHYAYDPDQANSILDAAGYRRRKDGIRFHLLMKISTRTETSLLIAAMLQHQLQKIEITPSIPRSSSPPFYSYSTTPASPL